MKQRLVIDSIVLRDDLLFGWGWFLADAAPVAHLRIVVRHRSGKESRFVCMPGGARPDVATAYPTIAHAASAGFILQGRLYGEWDGSSSEMHADLVDGTHLTASVEGFPLRFRGAVPSAESLRVKSAVALAMLRKADFKGFVTRLWRAVVRASGRTPSRERPDELQAIAGNMGLIFDHAMGGGANRFREKLVADIVASGGRICTVVPDLSTLRYRIAIADASGLMESTFPSLRDVLAFLDCQLLTSIEINDLVSFDDPLLVADWTSWKALQGVPVRFYLHDFHAVCPSWTLIDVGERYCGVPAPDVCARCLPRLEVPFLAFLPQTEIGHWRAVWSELLLRCEIVAFSAASVAILCRAYPALDRARIAVRPHVVDYLLAEPLALDLAPASQDQPLIVGVIGNISRHKGSDIVWEMAALIAAQHLPVRIVVIGTIESMVPSDRVTVLGPFQAEQLPRLLLDAHVDVCLLPSICPETYSYVTSELMQLQMPLAVFDLGAPAERVSGYDRGCIIPEVSARAALDSIQKLHRDLIDSSISTRQSQRV